MQDPSAFSARCTLQLCAASGEIAVTGMHVKISALPLSGYTGALMSMPACPESSRYSYARDGAISICTFCQRVRYETVLESWSHWINATASARFGLCRIVGQVRGSRAWKLSLKTGASDGPPPAELELDAGLDADSLDDSPGDS